LTNDDERRWLNRLSDELAAKGKRVLAYAFQIVPVLPSPFIYEEVEKNLKLAGLVALIDPPREEVKSAIAECKTAGIKPVMITGDHPATAKAIAREIGILEEHDLAITGAELHQLDEITFSEQVENIAVYARVSPDQK